MIEGEFLMIEGDEFLMIEGDEIFVIVLSILRGVKINVVKERGHEEGDC